jgi:hypothetical protein
MSDDIESEDYFGNSVSISDNYAIVGAYGEDTGGDKSGAAYVFELQDGSWNQVQKLVASNAGVNDYFGDKVAISGNYAIVGAYNESSNASGSQNNLAVYSGAAYIFERDPSTGWPSTQTQILKAGDIDEYDNFGYSVAISGIYAVVGAHKYNAPNTTNNTGAIFIFKRTGTVEDGSWNQVYYDVMDNITDDHVYGGSSVSIDGDYAVTGAYYDDVSSNGYNHGSACIYKRDPSTDNWSQTQIINSTPYMTEGAFGKSVSIRGNYIVIGASGESSNKGAA